MSWLTILSLALNVILLVGFFFRGAFNGLIREYVLGLFRDRRRRLDLLKRLDAYLETLPNLYFNWITFGALAERAPSDEEGVQAGQVRDQNHAEMAKALGFIRENRYDFPPKVQNS
jgi:hypothetical protein